ncbi:hypothetical protein BRADI_3g00835v3 [Brachypodium distachyon]|uniref:Uncharacterized protein n=1 Tax=Brachypodium distachyon TaxID=15368 RepID=A0A0Q3PTK1_BRADI|nr:hypothetical protein BRADI_3g00835v3 [Brachypodium distachyon]
MLLQLLRQCDGHERGHGQWQRDGRGHGGRRRAGLDSSGGGLDFGQESSQGGAHGAGEGARRFGWPAVTGGGRKAAATGWRRRLWPSGSKISLESIFGQDRTCCILGPGFS